MLQKLFSQTAIYGVSATLAKFLNYLLTPFLTRVLSEEVYGELSYLYAIIPFANVVLTLGFSSGYFRFAGREASEAEEKKLFTTLWGTVSLFALIFSGAGMLFFPSEAFVLMFALILVDNICALPLSLLRQRGKALYYTVANVSSVVVNVLLCMWFYTSSESASGSATWALLANLIASSVTLVMVAPYAIGMLSRGVSIDVLRKVGGYSLPLMVAGIMGVASDFIDRQMLRWVLPEEVALEQLGVYSAAAKIAALMVIFRQIYSLGAEPFFLQNFKKDDFAKLNAAALKYFVGVGVAIFLSLALFSDVFARIVGANFREGMALLPILLAANLFAGVLVNLSFWYKVADKTKYAIIVTLCGVTLSVVLNLVLIPTMGYAGAAWARISAMTIMVLVSYYLGQKYFPVRYDLRSVFTYLLLGALLFSAGYLTAEIENSWVRYATNLALVILYTLFFVRRENLLRFFKR